MWRKSAKRASLDEVASRNETGRQLLQLIDQRMGVVFDDQIKKFPKETSATSH